MICPIRELTHLMYELRPSGLVTKLNIKTPECIKESCTWWSNEKQICCIQLLGEKIDHPKMLND